MWGPLIPPTGGGGGCSIPGRCDGANAGNCSKPGPVGAPTEAGARGIAGEGSAAERPCTALERKACSAELKVVS